MQLRVLHNSADFYRNNLLFLKMAQKQSQSLIFATESLRPTLFMLMFDSLKQILKWVPTVIVDRTLTACNHNAAWCCRGC